MTKKKLRGEKEAVTLPGYLTKLNSESEAKTLSSCAL